MAEAIRERLRLEAIAAAIVDDGQERLSIVKKPSERTTCFRIGFMRDAHHRRSAAARLMDCQSNAAPSAPRGDAAPLLAA